uniref:Uncharacterized protein n=1 Tax=Bionectria ochroleuca TaxID=29856 RepID=A0A8H7KA10_BIOOC
MINTELDWLEIRLDALYDAVDVFIIVESPINFHGHAKPMHLRDSWDRFAKYHDKMLYHELEFSGSFRPERTWDIESLQRDASYEQVFPKLTGDRAPASATSSSSPTSTRFPAPTPSTPCAPATSPAGSPSSPASTTTPFSSRASAPSGTTPRLPTSTQKRRSNQTTSAAAAAATTTPVRRSRAATPTRAGTAAAASTRSTSSSTRWPPSPTVG